MGPLCARVGLHLAGLAVREEQSLERVGSQLLEELPRALSTVVGTGGFCDPGQAPPAASATSQGRELWAGSSSGQA